jgi:hypothetical protein
MLLPLEFFFHSGRPLCESPNLICQAVHRIQQRCHGHHVVHFPAHSFPGTLLFLCRLGQGPPQSEDCILVSVVRKHAGISRRGPLAGCQVTERPLKDLKTSRKGTFEAIRITHPDDGFPVAGAPMLASRSSMSFSPLCRTAISRPCSAMVRCCSATSRCISPIFSPARCLRATCASLQSFSRFCRFCTFVEPRTSFLQAAPVHHAAFDHSNRLSSLSTPDVNAEDGTRASAPSPPCPLRSLPPRSPRSLFLEAAAKPAKWSAYLLCAQLFRCKLAHADPLVQHVHASNDRVHLPARHRKGSSFEGGGWLMLQRGWS